MLFEPVKSKEGYIYKREKIDSETVKYYYKPAADEDARWIEFSPDAEKNNRDTIHKHYMTSPETVFISEDGQPRTKFDTKRRTIAAEKAKKQKHTAAQTDFTDKTAQPPSERDIAIKALEDSLDDGSAFNRYIDDKNFEQASKLIKVAFAKNAITREQREILNAYLNTFTNSNV